MSFASRLRSAVRRSHGAVGHPRVRQVAAVWLMALLASTQLLFHDALLDFWSVADLFQAWLEFLLELMLISLAMWAAFEFVEGQAARRHFGNWLRLPLIAVSMYAATLACTIVIAVWIHGWRVLSMGPMEPLALGEALRWSVLGIYIAAMHRIWQGVREADAGARVVAASVERLAADERELELQLLKAQIEPHFLFNTLANVRRLYRVQPDSGAQMMANLQGYLRAALPGVRRTDASLRDELALVHDYLALLQVRMGPRLSFCVSDSSGFGALPFPPMVVLTLVENAVRHGLDPLPAGGHVDVQAQCTDGQLQITVTDDGVGLEAAGTGGTGVGLTNIRRQLQARYGRGARLQIGSPGRGVVARIVMACTPAPQGVGV